jgi:hypothetical protein
VATLTTLSLSLMKTAHLFALILTGSSLFLCPALAGDISSFAALKGKGYHVSDDREHPGVNAGRAFFLEGYVRGVGLLSGTVQTPLRSIPLRSEVIGNAFFAFDGFWDMWTSDSAENLDSMIGIGPFQFTIGSVNDGEQTATINLPSAAFPQTIPTPGLFPGLQLYSGKPPFMWDTPVSYDPTTDLVITWNEFTDGGPNDFIQLAVASMPPSLGAVFVTAGYGQTGAIPASCTSFTIPAGLLSVTNARYTVTLRFIKVSEVDQGSITGATGVSGYFTETEFYVKTGDSSYGQPFPDNLAPYLTDYPKTNDVLNEHLRQVIFTFSESMAPGGRITFSPNVTVTSQNWMSWDRTSFICILAPEFERSAAVNYNLEGFTDLKGNPLPEEQTTGSFKTPAVEYAFRDSYLTSRGTYSSI